MSNSRLTDFVAILNDRVRQSRLGEPDTEGVIPIEPREIAFTTVFLDDMQDIGLVADSEVVHFEKRLGRANGKLNGFALSEGDAELTLICTISGGEPNGELRSIAWGEILKSIKAALHVYRAAKEPFHAEMEDSSPERDMIERFHSVRDQIQTIRVLVLINGATGKLSKYEQPGDLPRVTVDIWDIERLFRASSSGLAYESVTIDIENMLGAPLACLEGPVTEDDHRCYFAVIPGSLLHDLYQEHGPRLLELNVRSFLQARGKVNRGIRDTLSNDPGYFLAYNNGISATVETLELVKRKDGGVGIRQITGLQVVNGGQTMASIHRAKDRDKVDLSRVYVQAKITRITSDAVESLVPMISRFSNTQNKVNETDFSANHPFHVKFQQISESVWPPGETTRWFYERARGQWEVARIREGTTPTKLKAFDARTPRNQKLDKNLLSKAVSAWSEKPHIVSLGGQKCFISFMNDLKKKGQTWEPNEEYYRNAIAKVIVYKKAEKIARQIGFSAYRANAICYTIALIAFRTCGRLNLDVIWNNQDVSTAIEDTLRSWMPVIHEEIVESADGRNVTEWCKRKECWAMVQSLDLDFATGLEEELAEGQPLPNVGNFTERRGGASRKLSHEERERQAQVMKLSADEWQDMIAWMVEKPEYAGFPVQICATVLSYAALGWQKVPSPRQTKNVVQYIQAWNEYRNVHSE